MDHLKLLPPQSPVTDDDDDDISPEFKDEKLEEEFPPANCSGEAESSPDSPAAPILPTTPRYPRRNRKSPDRYADTYIHF